MAKFVVAGRAGCPSYARAEMLADKLATNLPDFKVHKIVLSQEDWALWVQEKCTACDWTHPHCSSPLIWRELIDRGGKGIYLGGVNDFEAYTDHYYKLSPDTKRDTEEAIAQENLDTFLAIQLEVSRSKPIEPAKVCITNASSAIAYQLAPLLLTERVLGDEKITIVLFDEESDDSVLHAMAMELQDMACPNLGEVIVTNLPQRAFTGAKVVFLLDYMQEEKCDEMLSKVSTKYTSYAGIMDFNADKEVLVMAAGPYANLCVALMANKVSSLSKSQFIASPATIEHQAASILASKIGVASSDVRRVGVWGSCDGDVIIDTSHTQVHNHKGSIVGRPHFSLPLRKCLFDLVWLKDEYNKEVVEHHSQLKSSLVDALGLARLMKSWWAGDGAWHSVGVVSEGEKAALCRPCLCETARGEWKWFEGVEIPTAKKDEIECKAQRLAEDFDKGVVPSSNEMLEDEGL